MPWQERYSLIVWVKCATVASKISAIGLPVVLHFRDLLGVVGSGAIPDFNVKNAHFIYPAADLSEQISTAGKEASSTGNMKFSLNGANVEIRKEVGPENFFLFGLTAAERPRDHYEQSATLREVIDFIASGALGRGDAELFRLLVENLLDHDPFLLLGDYHAYIDAQDRVSALWRDPHAWTRQSILNSALMGKFFSDRSIRDYCQNV
jgi:starch phosphorylase